MLPGFTNIPKDSFAIASGMPPTFVATTGLPHASALLYTTTVGKPSRLLGKQKTSQAFNHKGISSWFLVPTKES